MRAVESLWQSTLGILTFPALVLPFIVWWRGTAPVPVRFVLIATCLIFWTVLLANTAIEASPGQYRYRMPLTYLCVLATVASIRWIVWPGGSAVGQSHEQPS